LRQYRKLLEGFNDDLKFREMIQILIFGTATLDSSKGREGDA
jgi:hypothetical protein